MKQAVKRILSLCLTILPVVAGISHAEIYKWTDDHGQVHYSDRPSRQHSTSTVKVKINSYTRATITTNAGNPDGRDEETGAASAATARVVMYSTSWCGYCKKARNYFQANGIPFIEYDVETSAKGKRDYKSLKGTGVPIILVGSKRMNGFSEDGFRQIYAL